MRLRWPQGEERGPTTERTPSELAFDLVDLASASAQDDDNARQGNPVRDMFEVGPLTSTTKAEVARSGRALVSVPSYGGREVEIAARHTPKRCDDNAASAGGCRRSVEIARHWHGHCLPVTVYVWIST